MKTFLRWERKGYESAVLLSTSCHIEVGQSSWVVFADKHWEGRSLEWAQRSIVLGCWFDMW